jgi:hypothetical protein
MAAGLTTRHPVTGAVLSDPTTALTRILGTVYVPPNSAGFLDHAAFASGNAFAVGYAGGVPNIGSSQTYPTHTINGTRLSWNAAPLATTIVYGAYAGSTAGRVATTDPVIRFFTPSQSTQIDIRYANHCVLTSGGVNLVAGGSMSFTIAGTAPIVAYRGTNVITVLMQVKNADGTWTITLGAGAYAAAGTYYVFDVPAAGSQKFDTPVRLIMRHPTTNATIFDSRLKYLRFYGVRDNAAVDNVPVTRTTTDLGRDNLAAIVDPGLWFNQTLRQGEDQQGNPVYTDVYSPYFCGAGVNGTVLTEASVTVGSESPVAPAYTATGRTLLVDVANF